MKVEFYTFENLEDVWVKSWEQRDGLAVCSAADVNLVTTFNPEEYYRSDVLMYRTGDKNLFVVNTEHDLIKDGSQFINFNKPEKYVGFDIGGPNVCVVSTDLGNNIVGCEVPSEPAPETVVEPEDRFLYP